MSENYGNPITVGPVKLNFVNLAKPDMGGRFAKKKYVVTLLVRKDDTENMKLITDAIKNTGMVDKLSELEKHPLIDGEGELRDGDSPDMAQYPHYKGCIYFAAASKNRPECFVVDEDGKPMEVIDPDEIEQKFYNGCECLVILQPYMWEEGSVTLFLNSVLKVADGPRFGGKVDPKQTFLQQLAKGGGLKAKAAVMEAKAEAVDEDEMDEGEEEVDEVEAAAAAPKKRGRPKKKANGVDTDSSLAKGGKKKAAKATQTDLSAVLD